MKDATVDQRSRYFFIVFMTIPVNEMPATARKEFVGARYGGLPVLFLEGVVPVAFLAPIDRAEDGAQTEKEVGSHGRGTKGGNVRKVEKCGLTRQIVEVVRVDIETALKCKDTMAHRSYATAMVIKKKKYQNPG